MTKGKKFNPIKKIAHRRKRTVVKNKRRNGLLKKAVELSLLCEQQIYLVVYDPEQDRMIQFMSEPGFDIEKVYQKLQQLQKLKTKLSLRTYTNEDFIKELHSIGSDQESDDQGDDIYADEEQMLSQLQLLQNHAQKDSQMDIVNNGVIQKEQQQPFMAQKLPVQIGAMNSEKRIFGADSQMSEVQQSSKTLKECLEEKQGSQLPQKQIFKNNASGLTNQNIISQLDNQNSLKICLDFDSDINGNAHKRNFQNMQQSHIQNGIDDQYDLLQQKVRKTLGNNMGTSEMKNLYQPGPWLPPQQASAVPINHTQLIQQLQQNNQIGQNQVNIPKEALQQLKNNFMNGQRLQDQMQPSIRTNSPRSILSHQSGSQSLKINQNTLAVKKTSPSLRRQSSDKILISNMTKNLKSTANHQKFAMSNMPSLRNILAESKTPKSNSNLMEPKENKAEVDSTLNESDANTYQRLMDQINQSLMRNAHNSATQANSKIIDQQNLNQNQGFTDAIIQQRENFQLQQQAVVREDQSHQQQRMANAQVNEPIQNQVYNQMLSMGTNGLVQDNNLTQQSESQYSQNMAPNNEKIQALKSMIMQHQQQKIQFKNQDARAPRQKIYQSTPDNIQEQSLSESVEYMNSEVTKHQTNYVNRTDQRQTSLFCANSQSVNGQNQEQFGSIHQQYLNQKIGNAANNELTVGSNAHSNMNGLEYTPEIQRLIDQQNGAETYGMKKSSSKHDLMSQINRKKMLRYIRPISTQTGNTQDNTKSLNTYSFEMGPNQMKKQEVAKQPIYAQQNQLPTQNYMMNLEPHYFMNPGKKPVNYSQFRPAFSGNTQDEMPESIATPFSETQQSINRQ